MRESANGPHDALIFFSGQKRRVYSRFGYKWYLLLLVVTGIIDSLTLQPPYST